MPPARRTTAGLRAVLATALMLTVALATLFAAPPAAATHVPADEIRWACGFGGGGTQGHPDNCGIDPVGGSDAVGSTGAATYGDAWIEGEERVLGVVVEGEARAFPLKMLSRHEIANTEIADRKVAVTYCPLCGSGVTFDRMVDLDGPGKNGTVELNFTASGFLWQSDLVMWEDRTGTLWNQILGEPIGTLDDSRVRGHHLDAELTMLSTEILTWAGFLDRHPDAKMLQPVLGASSYRDPYEGYYRSCAIGVGGGRQCDIDGLHPKTVVIGVQADGGAGGDADGAGAGNATAPGPAVAYPQEGVVNVGGVVAATFEGRTYVVVSEASGGTTVYDAGEQTFEQTDGDVWEDADGNAWDLRNGRRADGTETLPKLNALTMFWFAWKEHQPDTLLWTAGGSGDEVGPDQPALPGPGGAAVVLALVGAGLLWAGWRRRRAA